MNETPRVLIVEDETIIACDIKMQLSNSGFNVTSTAQSAAAAFQRIEQDCPDLVLMDIRIQGDMDGITAAGIIRDRYALPVIYLTAHADEPTLQRAQLTEPYGYIVKPLCYANIKPMITMALHKHGTERQLQNHREMLASILQGLPDAVLVTDPSGGVLFLNDSAEELTGWTQKAAAGRSLREIAPIEDAQGHLITTELLQNAVDQKSPVWVPRNSALITRCQGATQISGQIRVARLGNQHTAGVFFTLHDATALERQEERLRQERQLLAVGELAKGVGQEFHALLDLIGCCADDISKTRDMPEANLIKRASQIGKEMSLHLLDFREAHGSAYPLNVGHYLEGSKSLLQRFCSSEVTVDVSSAPEAGYVITIGNHFERLLMHLCHSARRFLNGAGALTVTGRVHQESLTPSRSRSYIHLAFLADRSARAAAASTSTDEWPLGNNLPDLNLPIIRASAIAFEGFVRASHPSDCTSLVEVFLPRHESRNGAALAANELSRVFLLVGLPDEFIETVKTAASGRATFLEAANLGEASLISELYPGDIDVIVVNDSEARLARNGRSCERIRARRPAALFLPIDPTNESSEADTVHPSNLDQWVKSFFESSNALAVSSVHK